MPGPVIGPCGGTGQPACPPTPAISVNPGDVIEFKGKKYRIDEEEPPKGPQKDDL